MPLVLVFILGAVLRKCGIVCREEAELLLKLFFNVSLPALILISIPALQLQADLLFLPLIAAVILFCSYAVAFLGGKALRLQRTPFAVFLLGAMIMNGGFAFPFILAAYGREGMALASLFDFGGAIVVFTFAYYLACRYGSGESGATGLLRKFLFSPPLWALCLALVLNLTGTNVGTVAGAFLRPLAEMTTPLVLLALGVAFSHRLRHAVPALAAVTIRMLGGFFLGLVCVELFNLHGLSRNITLIMAAAPSGINTLAFSALENLDTELAAGIVSYATLLGLFWLPLLIYAQQ